MSEDEGDQQHERAKARALDGYLAAAARLGDRAALRSLALRFDRRLYRHACRLAGDAEMARDIAQDAWVDIVRGLQRLDDASSFAAYAFRITTRRAVDAIRRKKRARDGVAAFAAEPREEAANDGGAHMNAEIDALNKAMRALPSEQRAAIALFYLEDLSVAEIAVALDVPAGTVKTRLMAARDKLKNAIGENEEA